MARVPGETGRQVGIRPLGSQGFSMRAPDASGLARGIEQVENGVIRRVEEEREKADTAAVLQADRELTDWQNSAMFNPETGVYTRKGSNALDITGQTLQDFEQSQQRIGQTLKSESQRARYETIVARRRQSLGGELNKYEFQQRQSYYDQVDQGQIETSMQSAALYYNDPEQVEHFRSKVGAVVRSQAARKGLPEEMVQSQIMQHNSALSTSVVNRMANDDPYKARDYFQQAQGYMTAEDRIQVDRMITREIKARELEARQRQAIAKVELTSRVQDAEAAYLQGLDFAKPPARQEFLGALGMEEGAARYEQFLKVQSLGSTVRELATADPQERMRLVDSFNPAAEGVAGEGFKQDAQLFGVALQAANALNKEMQNDPAGYAAKYSPLIRGALAGLQSGEPEAAQAYAVATLAEQERMGSVDPRLLSNSQADAIIRQFGVTDDGGSDAAAMITQLQNQWGKHWPTVYKQLQPKLPGAALIIGSGVDEATASTLARIAPLKTEELKRGLEPTDVSDAKALLRDSLAPFRQTLAQQGGGERTYATIDREAERLTLAYMGQGKAPKDAAKEAVRALVDDKYTIKGSWRAPISFDADLIERGAAVTIQSINPIDLASAVPPGVSPEFANERVKAAIDQDGEWATLPDESGLALYYRGAAVLDKAGNPITRSWQTLMGEAVQNPSTFSRVSKGLGEGIDALDNEPINPYLLPSDQP